ncbi:hypothetical protein [Flavobacterium sp. I3-2]|uniref:hypothetical protein n=1 Tax=Flavobacterium sp. I3-2 TaxID=2748319 RepID=UPI0015A78FA8|nr:hypothetical protein [Flavobacterium sp. I3-2]
MMIGANVFAQKVRPTTSSSTNNTFGVGLTVAQRLRAYDVSETVNEIIIPGEDTFTQLTVPSNLALYSTAPKLTLEHSSIVVPANKNYFIKFDLKEGQILDSVLGGYVGDLLNNVVSAIAGGIPNTKFTFSNSTTSFSAGTHGYSVNDQLKMKFLRDGLGNNYIMVNLDFPFNKIEIHPDAGGVLGIAERWTKIYDSYYYSSNPECFSFLTYSQVSQSLLTAAGTSGIQNPQSAIDNNLETYSTFGNQSLLSLGLGMSMEQFFQLPDPSNNKLVRIKMQMPASLLDVSVASGIEVNFYNGSTKISSQMVDSSIIGADVLGLINAGNNVPFSFLATPPTDAAGNRLNFDKVSISVKQPVNLEVLDVTGDLRIYDVAFVDIKPEVKKVCSREFITNNIRERKFDIRHIIPNFNEIIPGRYLIVDQNQNVIIDQLSTATYPTVESVKWQPLGTYYIKGINEPGYCSNQYESFVAEQDKQYTITGKSAISLPLDSNNDNTPDASFIFTSSLYSSDLPDNTGVRIYDELTNIDVTNQTVSFSAIGSYNYYAKSVNAANDTNVTCDIVKRITVYVYDQEECEYRFQRVGANYETVSQVTLLGIPLAGSSNSAATIDKSLQITPDLYMYDLSTHGSIFNELTLAGLGTISQDLLFKTGDNINASSPNKQIAPGTPLTIKLGQDYSVLEVLGGITIRPINTFGQPVGSLLSIGEFDLANVLVGDNVFEYTFVPKGDNGENIWYSGVRINLGSVLGVGNTVKIYGAYIDERVAIAGYKCNSNIVIEGAESRVRDANGKLETNLDTHLLLNTSASDVLYGTEDTGLGVATSLSSVLYPYYAADAIEDTTNVNNPLNGTPNYQTAAVFNSSVGALNKQTLTVKFKDIARPGDKVRITMSSEGIPVLDLNLLSNFTVQRYLGSTPIGDEVTKDDFSLIKLDLLKLIADQASNKYVLTLEGIGASFDRVELHMDNVVSANLLGTKTYIYDVSVIPNFEFNENVIFCTSAPFRVEKLDPCSGYNLSFVYATLGAVADPITGEFDILGWNDIQNSTLPEIGANDPRYDDEYHQYQLNKLYAEYSSVNNLYLKVVTKRQGCIYGDTQYFKIKIKNCSTISNPMIRTRLKSN